jgi:hypothetical protein
VEATGFSAGTTDALAFAIALPGDLDSVGICQSNGEALRGLSELGLPPASASTNTNAQTNISTPFRLVVGRSPRCDAIAGDVRSGSARLILAHASGRP